MSGVWACFCWVKNLNFWETYHKMYFLGKCNSLNSRHNQLIIESCKNLRKHFVCMSTVCWNWLLSFWHRLNLSFVKIYCSFKFVVCSKQLLRESSICWRVFSENTQNMEKFNINEFYDLCRRHLIEQNINTQNRLWQWINSNSNPWLCRFSISFKWYFNLFMSVLFVAAQHIIPWLHGEMSPSLFCHWIWPYSS